MKHCVSQEVTAQAPNDAVYAFSMHESAAHCAAQTGERIYCLAGGINRQFVTGSEATLALVQVSVGHYLWSSHRPAPPAPPPWLLPSTTQKQRQGDMGGVVAPNDGNTGQFARWQRQSPPRQVRSNSPRAAASPPPPGGGNGLVHNQQTKRWW